MANIHYIQDIPSQGNNQEPESFWDTIKKVFFPKFNLYSVTMLLATTNVVFFVFLGLIALATSIPYQCILYFVGALYPPTLIQFQIHRLVMPAFLHFDIGHITLNTLMLLFLGFDPEEQLGRVQYLVIYFGSSVFGFMLSAVGLPTTLTAGASAAIMGLFGFWLVQMYLKMQEAGSRTYGVFAAVIIINLLLFLNPDSGNMWAHLGGVYFGVLYSLIKLSPDPIQFPAFEPVKKYSMLGIIIFPIATTFLYLVLRKNSPPICSQN